MGERRTRREFLRDAAAAMAAGGAAAVLPLGCGGGKTSAKAAPAARGQAPTLADVNGPRSLRAAAAAHGMLVGCAVNPEKLDGEPEYAKTVAEQANLLVAENAMKWGALRPAADQFDFRGADDIMVFALTHNQRVRGHNLCWHEDLPAWFATTVNRENAAHFLTQHIATVAGRYAGKMQSWDVVNEAVDVKSGRPDGLRDSPWLKLIGPGYIELAFRTARPADPHALLTYNDYGIELDTPEQIDKRGQVMMLVRRLRARGVPIDAVGVQSHLTAGDPLPGAGLLRFVRELGAMGLQVFITELDVNDRDLPEAVEARDAAVAAVYREYLTMMLAEPNVNVALTWGITDRYTWLQGAKHGRADGRPERPLPFDYDYQPTPAFFAERAAIEGRRKSVLPSADPYAPFRPGTEPQ
ncbi:MAG: endo-1,4-beta-xylanase [Acidobacteriaceae bacterium]